MLTFHEYVRLRETAGDSWGTAPAPPVQIMLGPNAPIAGNLTGSKPPTEDEQYPPKELERQKQKRKRREIRTQPYDDPRKLKRDVERARELGVEP
jgi:hypothetical protein